jgi:uncharacterized RDD family membrane protein YckC
VSYPPPSPPSGPGWQPPPQQGGWQPPPQQGGWQPPPQQGGWQPPTQPGAGGGGGGFGGGSGGAQHNLAEWPQRAIGGLIEWLPILALVVINYLINSFLLWVLIVALEAAYWGWLGYEDGTKGANWAKKIAGVRVVKKDTGQLAGSGVGIARMFLHLLDVLPCCIWVGFLFPLVDKDKQTFSDKIVGTVVVKV